MEVHTTQPGLQLYTGNALDGSGRVNGHRRWTGVCVETQHLPDSVNQPGFPSTILRPGRTYREETVCRFSLR
jgi:aldose 1-epimerase